MNCNNSNQIKINHPFLTCPESREGLSLLSNDVYKFLTKPNSESNIKILFINMIRIFIACAMIAFGLNSGWYIFKLIIGGF